MLRLSSISSWRNTIARINCIGFSSQFVFKHEMHFLRVSNTNGRRVQIRQCRKVDVLKCVVVVEPTTIFEENHIAKLDENAWAAHNAKSTCPVNDQS
ncbi:unnamed protein product [Caenorhabditis angaria]|uniref:Uncharacterized protein n=1 Tax=Caenorhabditis angaria TaxID=860376 RepID=A0A9P1IUY5_9PELO|nr:unnamed protein product [Caenorhabditis angaria]